MPNSEDSNSTIKHDNSNHQEKEDDNNNKTKEVNDKTKEVNDKTKEVNDKTKEAWRKARSDRKCRKRERAIEKRREEQTKWASLTEEKKTEIRANALRVHENRIALAEAHKRQCINNIDNQSLPCLVFDLSHWNIMTDRGKKSTIMQLKYSYSILKKSGFIMRPVLTSLDPKATGCGLLQQLVDYEGFKVFPPKISPEHWQGILLDKEKVIYLSADSDNVLSTIDPGYYYIIGAFVDHNMKKGLTESTAKRIGVRTMRLPISETISVGNLCKVLTINHVTEVLKVFMETSSWLKAFDVLPTRRQKKQRLIDGISVSVSSSNVQEEELCEVLTDEEGDTPPSHPVMSSKKR